MAKLAASEAAHKAADKAMQILASAGYRRGSVVERLFRDVRATEIYQGTSEAQRMIIAAGLARERVSAPCLRVNRSLASARDSRHRSVNSLLRLPGNHALLERAPRIGLGRAFRNAERLPLRAREMFRQQSDLADVIRGMRQRSVQRFERPRTPLRGSGRSAPDRPRSAPRSTPAPQSIPIPTTRESARVTAARP